MNEEMSDKENMSSDNDDSDEESDTENEHNTSSPKLVKRSPPQKFHWEGVIRKILTKAQDHEMGVKKLRKLVLTAYMNTGQHKPSTVNELNSKFNHKISHNPKFKLHKEKVKLVKK